MGTKHNRIPVIAALMLTVIFSMAYYGFLEQGLTGAPGEVACAPCHHDPAPGLGGGASLNGLPQYVFGGQSYPMTVEVYTNDDVGETAGFQLTLLDTDGTSHGTLTESDTYVQLAQFGSRDYVQHADNPRFYGDDFEDIVTFHFQWTPEMVTEVTPVQGYTSIVLGDGNAVGTGGGQRGDSVFTLTQGVTVVPLLTGNLNVVSVPLCNDGDEGALEVSYNGGLPPITVQWSTGGNTPLIQGLTAGQYSVTVSDVAGQQLMFSQQLTAPDPLGVSAAIMDPACYNTTDGSISLQVQGGTPPYTYLVNGNPTLNPVLDLAPGNYSISVTDANGCTSTVQTALEAPEEIEIDLIDIVPQTTGMGGAIVIELSGGTLPYDFFWTGPNDYTNTIQNPFNLEAGTYQLTVTDGNGCTQLFTAEVDFASGVRDLSQGYQIGLSPNPGGSVLHIRLPEGISDTWDIRCLSFDGTPVFSMQTQEGPGSEIRIAQTWPQGGYLIGLYGRTSGIVVTGMWLKLAE